LVGPKNLSENTFNCHMGVDDDHDGTLKFIRSYSEQLVS